MIDFTDLIKASAEWTTTVLFRPFSFKKWIILGFVALMAGYLSGGGCHFSFHESRPAGKSGIPQAEAAVEVVQKTPASDVHKKDDFDINKIRDNFLQSLRNPFLVFAGAVIFLLVLILIIVMTWLYSRFLFVFLDDIVKNSAVVKIPFKENAREAGSFFLLALTFTCIFLSCLVILVGMFFQALFRLGVFDKAHHAGFKAIILTFLPYGIIFFILLVLFGIFHWLMQDFVVVAMYREKITAKEACLKMLFLLKAHTGVVTEYFFIRLGLLIGAFIATGLLVGAAFVGLMLPAVPLALVTVEISRFIPKSLQTFYFFLTGGIGGILLIAASCCLVLLYLPFGVFFRTLSVKFLGRLDFRYNLFQNNPTKE